MRTATCRQCGKTFEYDETAEHQSQPRVHRPKYCSLECLVFARSKHGVGEKRAQAIFDCIKGGTVDFGQALFVWSDDHPWDAVWDDHYHLEGGTPESLKVVYDG